MLNFAHSSSKIWFVVNNLIITIYLINIFYDFFNKFYLNKLKKVYKKIIIKNLS